MMNTIHLDHLGYINTYIYIYGKFLGFARNSTTQRQSYYHHHRHHHHHQSGNTCWLVTLHLLNVTAANRLYNWARIRLKLTRVQAAAGRTLFLLKPPSSAIHSRRRVARDRGGSAVIIEATFQTPKFKEKQQVNWNNNLSWNTKVSLRPLRNVSTRAAAQIGRNESNAWNGLQATECLKCKIWYKRKQKHEILTLLQPNVACDQKSSARIKFPMAKESSSPWPEWSSPCRPNGSPLQSVFCWSFHGGEISALPGIHFVPNYLSFVDESWKQMIISQIFISTIWWWKIGIISWNLDLLVFPVSIISWLDLDMLTYTSCQEAVENTRRNHVAYKCASFSQTKTKICGTLWSPARLGQALQRRHLLGRRGSWQLGCQGGRVPQ